MERKALGLSPIRLESSGGGARQSGRPLGLSQNAPCRSFHAALVTWIQHWHVYELLHTFANFSQ
jgi:hypothetical protein